MKRACIAYLLGTFLLCHVQAQTAQTTQTVQPAQPASNNLLTTLKNTWKSKKDSILTKGTTLNVGNKPVTLAKNGTTTTSTAKTTAPTTGTSSNVPIVNNGTPTTTTDPLSFEIDGCVGNQAAQTVTVFFTVGNPAAVNQIIFVGLGPACKVIDPDGNLCKPKNATLADGDGTKWTELPYGLKMKGTVTFFNVLPKNAQLALLQFNVFTRNADGADAQVKAKNVVVRNLAVTWQ
jgi:hypothetical protein